MIAQINGMVAKIADQSVIIQVSGIGFQVYLARIEQLAADKNVLLYTYMHWNQEQGPTLFGFFSEFERDVFMLIISCSGIGPKIALAVLRNMNPGDFITAIGSHDLQALSAVSGIGAKKAEQIIMQLKHKVAKLLKSGQISGGIAGGPVTHFKDISDALASLNYSRPEVNRAMQYLHEQAAGNDYSFDQLFRQALSFLSKRG